MQALRGTTLALSASRGLFRFRPPSRKCCAAPASSTSGRMQRKRSAQSVDSRVCFHVSCSALLLCPVCQDSARVISRIRQRWAQSAPDGFVTLQPLPSSLTRALDSASPNPCLVSTGLSSDPVAPVSHQVAPLQMAIHSSWPSPSGGAIRVPVPRALPALPLPPAPAPACRWRDGSYARVGPVSASLSAPVAC